jgi:hypothetical protein
VSLLTDEQIQALRVENKRLNTDLAEATARIRALETDLGTERDRVRRLANRNLDTKSQQVTRTSGSGFPALKNNLGPFEDG